MPAGDMRCERFWAMSASELEVSGTVHGETAVKPLRSAKLLVCSVGLDCSGPKPLLAFLLIEMTALPKGVIFPAGGVILELQHCYTGLSW